MIDVAEDVKPLKKRDKDARGDMFVTFEITNPTELTSENTKDDVQKCLAVLIKSGEDFTSVGKKTIIKSTMG